MAKMPRMPSNWNDDLTDADSALTEPSGLIQENRPSLSEKPWWAGEGAPFVPTPGGLLDGLPRPNTGSSLHFLMSPEDIANIDGPDDGKSPGDYGSRSQQQEAPEVQIIGQ